MLIDNNMLEESLGISMPSKVEFKNIGLVGHALPEMLTFIEASRYIPVLLGKPNIKGVFVSKELANEIPASRLQAIVCDDPRHSFYTLYNFRAKKSYRKVPSAIDPSVVVGYGAYVAEHNVVIGRNTVIGPGAIILPDVIIGNDCAIGAGSIIGCDDAEIKRTSQSIFKIVHDGSLRIGDRVDIGASCTVDKGFSFQDTVIGDDTKLANRTYVGHCAQIGQRCMLFCCTVLGSAIIEDDVRINPGAIIANQVRIGAKATVTLGSVVVEPVGAGCKVAGNFAVDHNKFLYFLAKTFGQPRRVPIER